MRGFERETHATWHRRNDDPAQCPWCPQGNPRPQSSAHSKRTNRTYAASPAPSQPARHSVKQSGHDKADFSSHVDSHVDLNPAPDDTEASPETGSQYTKYLGRTETREGSNGAFTTEPSRPRLPDAWTQDAEEPDTGTRDWDKMRQHSSSELELQASGDYREGEETAGSSLEPHVEG